jgi:ADP-heptose:LPS heptosyltransferase
MDRFRQLALELKHEFRLQIVWFLENPAQRSICPPEDPIFCGPLNEVAAALQLCRLAIANDSGLMHLAIAAGCKTVQLFGPGNAEQFAHHGPQTVLIHDKSCQFNPCTRSGDCKNQAEGWCMGKITVEMVFTACQQLLTDR